MEKYPNVPESVIRALMQTNAAAPEWREMLKGKLQNVATLAVHGAEQALVDGTMPPSQLMFVAGIAIDKTATLDGGVAMAGVSMTQIVNNYYGSSKDDLLASLDGRQRNSSLLPAFGGPKESYQNAELVPATATLSGHPAEALDVVVTPVSTPSAKPA